MLVLKPPRMPCAYQSDEEFPFSREEVTADLKGRICVVPCFPLVSSEGRVCTPEARAVNRSSLRLSRQRADTETSCQPDSPVVHLEATQGSVATTVTLRSLCGGGKNPWLSPTQTGRLEEEKEEAALCVCRQAVHGGTRLKRCRRSERV